VRKETGLMQLLHLVVLADIARTDKVLDSRACNWNEEVGAKPMESFLDSLVADPMHAGDDLRLGR
jgi:hypothetical protein